MTEEVFGREELNRPIDSERLNGLFGKENDEDMREQSYEGSQLKAFDELRKKNNDLEKQIKELQEENARLKKDSEENQDLATVAYMQGASKYKAKLDEAKEIISELLKYIFTPEGFEKLNKDMIVKAEAFLKEC